MIDLAFLRDNPELVKRSQEARGELVETARCPRIFRGFSARTRDLDEETEAIA